MEEGDAFSKTDESQCHHTTFIVWAGLRFGIAWTPGRPGGYNTARSEPEGVEFRAGQLASRRNGKALWSAEVRRILFRGRRHHPSPIRRRKRDHRPGSRCGDLSRFV